MGVGDNRRKKWEREWEWYERVRAEEWGGGLFAAFQGCGSRREATGMSAEPRKGIESWNLRGWLRRAASHGDG